MFVPSSIILDLSILYLLLGNEEKMIETKKEEKKTKREEKSIQVFRVIVRKYLYVHFRTNSNTFLFSTFHSMIKDIPKQLHVAHVYFFAIPIVLTGCV